MTYGTFWLLDCGTGLDSRQRSKVMGITFLTSYMAECLSCTSMSHLMEAIHIAGKACTQRFLKALPCYNPEGSGEQLF